MFVNLHCHFDYSILDGAMKVEAGVQRAVELGQTALAITDHGSMGGAYELVKRCTTAGIKPIVGLEAYVAPHDRTVKTPVFWGSVEQRRDDISGSGKYCHLTLIARDATGIRNLYRLQHSGYATGFYGKPRLDFDSLGQHSGGITCLTGCLGGHVQTALRVNRPDIAEEALSTLKDIFGEHLYVELMDHGLDIENAIRPDLLGLAKHFGLPTVATNDAHYARLGDSDLHDTLLCVQTQKRKSDSDRFRFEGSGYHLASSEEMGILFQEIPGALHSTVAIAESVEGYGEFFQPVVRLPKYSENEELDLERLAYGGCANDTLDYQQRLEYELQVINSQGYAGYFLTLMDVMNDGKAIGIRFGPGRGSVGGSVVAYALGITTVDPIRHGLLFERFLNPERISFPDIDTDIDDTRRDEFIKLVRDKFGEDYVAHSGQYGIVGAKSGLRDAARVLGYPYSVGTDLVSLLPRPKFGRHPSLSELPAKTGPKEVVESARGMEGVIRSAGIHPSAVVISPDSLVDLIPLKIPGGKRGLTAEFTGSELDELGYVKYDFLGLVNLGVIDECLELLSSRESSTSGDGNLLPEVRRAASEGYRLPTSFDDPRTFALLGSGKTTGVFQLDGYGMRTLLRKVQPNSLDDIAAVLALHRPGPMGANSHNVFADRKAGRADIEYPHREYETVLSEILSPTHGLIVFQEQVLRILAVVGGYTYATAGLIFDAMRKKDTEKMLSAKPDFEGRLRNNGYSDRAIEALWETLVPFSDYSFNKSHSIGYATISYWTAYLKANHPREYYCSLLSRESEPDVLRSYIYSAVEEGIRILPPDINLSGYGWTLTDDGITFGLGSVKGISEATFKHIAAGRPYLSMEEWWERAHSKVLNLGVLSAAVRSGAFDQLEPNREQLYENLEALAARALEDRNLATRGHKRLWKTYMVLPGKPRLALRQTWEEELLGTTITQRAIRLVLKRRMTDDEWFYVKRTLDLHPGSAPVDVQVGPLTTLRGVGKMALTEKALRALEALGTLDIQEDE